MVIIILNLGPLYRTVLELGKKLLLFFHLEVHDKITALVVYMTGNWSLIPPHPRNFHMTNSKS